ncbi:HIRAN domain-containing protein [Blastopirellula marina]|uniref:HIRAN domain-containing protein n=1 Tax=Blastopirellula marina TaxID=124 RepID=A0A2S8GES0_9BACT|nr:HIRAN domain-containing protein [Blastopirellula marina]PQO42810.1 hypothetical protein C5Y98_01250 [Blastopirellula marina]PTL46576.1 hypothetical protein C5Y97_01250 [Blastopirellula marina]
MTNTTNTDPVFVCSYCEQAIKFKSEQQGKCVHCPKCRRKVWVFSNRQNVIDSALTTNWYFKRPRFLLTDEQVGPISDEKFLELMTSPEGSRVVSVRSPEFTADSWVEPEQINLEFIQTKVQQRSAEQARRARKEQRRQETHAKNRQTLTRAISMAVSDGNISLKERSKLHDFAKRAGIPAHEVDALLKYASARLLQDVVEECLEDGLLEPHEKQRIGDLATSLGVPLNFTEEQQRRIKMCDFAWKLLSGTYTPIRSSPPNVQLSSNENPIVHCTGKYFEIAVLKRPAGIPLGNDHYLKEITSGTCLLTDKRLYVSGAYASKKVTLNSIVNASWHQDGLFLNRSTGKSVFIAPSDHDDNWYQFAMLVQHTVTQQPVLGVEPTTRFVPEIAETNSTKDTHPTPSTSSFHTPDEPRFTFRVVGDHIGDRSNWIFLLDIGDPVKLHREPSNPVDPNAVMVLDSNNHLLGYLKREVAVWFAPILDGGRRYHCLTHRKLNSGGLIVGVYEL